MRERALLIEGALAIKVGTGAASRYGSRFPHAGCEAGGGRLMPIPLVTRILIADDFAIVRSGLKKVLDAKPDLEVVAEAEDGARGRREGAREDVDLGDPRRLDAADDGHPGRCRAAEAQARAEDC